jgi:hypothetical protein
VLGSLPPDELWCLGDLVGYGADPNAVIDRVQRDGTVGFVAGGGEDDDGRGRCLQAEGLERLTGLVLELGEAGGVQRVHVLRHAGLDLELRDALLENGRDLFRA